MININSPLILKNIVIKNRLAKGAMSEGLAPKDGRINEQILNLYTTWAKGGLGFCISGNVMIDHRAINEPGVIIIEDESDLLSLKRWAQIGHDYNMVQIIQLSHPGKQAPKDLNRETVAPSAIGFEKKSLQKSFGIPRELSEAEIYDLINRFAQSAVICEKAGLHGIQLHGAHGYLINQFLSPLHNKRSDQWGGSLEKRMHFVIQVYKEIRKRTSPKFIVGIKLNSADFQKGGLTFDDAKIIFKALDDLGIDFIEISGGNYESPVMVKNIKESTQKREAYFLEFAEIIRHEIKTKLMVTGGFRTVKAMNEALQNDSLDLIGIARPLAVAPNCPKQFLKGEELALQINPIKSGISFIDKLAILEIIWYAAQFRLIGNNKKTNPHLSPLSTLFFYFIKNIKSMTLGRNHRRT